MFSLKNTQKTGHMALVNFMALSEGHIEHSQLASLCFIMSNRILEQTQVTPRILDVLF
jgi:hypothetical protein